MPAIIRGHYCIQTTFKNVYKTFTIDGLNDAKSASLLGSVNDVESLK